MTPRIEWDNPNAVLSQVKALLEKRHLQIRRVPELAIRAGAIELQTRIRTDLPKKTVALSRSVMIRFERPAGGEFIARIGSSLEYAPYVEYGTGIYGPKGKPIVPVTARALAWPGRPIYATSATKSGRTMVAKKADVNMIVRRSVKGMKPRPVYARSTAEFLPRYVAIIERELARETYR